MANKLAFNAWVANEDYCPLENRTEIAAIAALTYPAGGVPLAATIHADKNVSFLFSTFQVGLVDLLIVKDNQSRVIATLTGSVV